MLILLPAIAIVFFTFAIILIFFFTGDKDDKILGTILWLTISVVSSPIWLPSVVNIHDQRSIATIIDATILELPKRSLNDRRLYVSTDKGFFIVKDSYLNGTYNNTERYFSLKVGAKYDLLVCGIGKGYFTDYKNILSHTKKNSK